MPELPEVETVRLGLVSHITGRSIVRACVSPEALRILQRPTVGEFIEGLIGRRIEDVQRRGKYLLLPLDDGHTLIIHLRMTGRLLYRCQSDPSDEYVRAFFALDNGHELRFADPRKLGCLWLVSDAREVVGYLGPEPLPVPSETEGGRGLTSDYLSGQLARRAAPIKSVLLDQSVIAGIGNIYADESLFMAGIHPQRPAKSLNDQEVLRLQQAIVAVLARGLDMKGSSFRWFVDAEGNKGRHHEHVRVFRRTGQPCYVCGETIQRIKVGGRSTHFCPRCQQ